MKRFFSALISALIIFAALPMSAAAAEINTDDVVIYGLDGWAQEYIEVPSDYAQSFQIDTKGAQSVKFSVVSGDSVEVSSTGLITQHKTVWYWYGGMGTTVPDPNREPTRVTTDVDFGKSVVRVTADGKTYDINVNVKDYATVYADEQMDEYISQMITDDMNIYQKVERACMYAASFDYSTSASSATSMIIKGGGDCWASTDVIIKICKKLGIKAWSRNGNRDSGAGSGHENAMVEVAEGEYIEAEAGYYEEAPRSYDVTKRSSLFSYRGNGDGIEVYQYDGYETPEVFEVPETIDGKAVTSIGDSFISMNSEVKTVILPDTVKSIGRSAFNSCENLEAIEIPASVEEIGDFVFTKCNKLTSLTVSRQNNNFCSLDGALYNKKMTKLLYAPTAANMKIPSTVTEIADYAFYYNYSLRFVEIPESVVNIGEGAFCNCEELTDVLMKNGVEEIGLAAFANCYKLSSVRVSDRLKTIGGAAFADTKIKSVTLPQSLESIGGQAFNRCNSLATVNFTGSEAQWTAAVGENDIKLPTSATVVYGYNPETDILIYDVNKDGETDGSDVTALLKFLVARFDGSTLSRAAMDANGDGEINVKDATYIQRKIVE